MITIPHVRLNSIRKDFRTKDEIGDYKKGFERFDKRMLKNENKVIID